MCLGSVIARCKLTLCICRRRVNTEFQRSLVLPLQPVQRVADDAAVLRGSEVAGAEGLADRIGCTGAIVLKGGQA